MTEEKIKEELSRHFIGVLASKMGVKIVTPLNDYGVDFTFKQVKKYKIHNKIRYVDSGRILGVQLKCTTESNVKKGEISFKFDLPVTNYNDLIDRYIARTETLNAYVPLVLIVVILTNDEKDWIKLYKDKGQVILKGKGYWFYPSLDMDISLNQQTKRIEVPFSNQIDLDFFQKMFNLFF